MTPPSPTGSPYSIIRSSSFSGIWSPYDSLTLISSPLPMTPSQSLSRTWKTSKIHCSQSGSSRWLSRRRDTRKGQQETSQIVWSRRGWHQNYSWWSLVRIGWDWFSSPWTQWLFPTWSMGYFSADTATAILIEQFEGVLEIVNICFTKMWHFTIVYIRYIMRENKPEPSLSKSVDRNKLAQLRQFQN